MDLSSSPQPDSLPCIEPLIAEQILQELLGRIFGLALLLLLPLLLLLGLRLCLFGGRLPGDCLGGLRWWCRMRWRFGRHWFVRRRRGLSEYLWMFTKVLIQEGEQLRVRQA